ncbi:hypothetical protein SAMN05444377_101230 [Flavobacterium fontis]|uniref:Uncharacterized protein n=1 Tax=Flavobacterium fontis TaxID=1124188 RepID=A0A1M4WA71_9FLAO|nr:hypothetical protein [Flavobacterium fontis]SHE78158.1 hypothetical protein SAMN05444377_101230 [Flavobacterium fontis]
MENKEILKLLKKLLSEVKSKSDNNFEGLGLIVYKDFVNLPIIPFNDEKCIRLPIKDFSVIVDTLLKISNCHNEFHDGFHLISKEFQLTHISNYFSTPIIEKIKIEKKYGSRYRTALYGSFLPNVLFTAVLSKNYGPIIFEKGRALSY